MKQPSPEVKKEIRAKLTAYIQELTNEFLKQPNAKATNDRVGVFMWELMQTYGMDAVMSVTCELNASLNDTSKFD